MRLKTKIISVLTERKKTRNTMADSSLWVFGYGSLCWHPGFEYGDKAVGHIRHFARKFWQGNTEHRGTAEKVRRRTHTHTYAFLPQAAFLVKKI